MDGSDYINANFIDVCISADIKPCIKHSYLSILHCIFSSAISALFLFIVVIVIVLVLLVLVFVLLVLVLLVKPRY